MKKLFCILIGLCLLTNVSFAKKIKDTFDGKKATRYVNDDESVDLKLFYADWNKIPDTYYLYILKIENEPLADEEQDESEKYDENTFDDESYAVAYSYPDGATFCYMYAVYYSDYTFSGLLLLASPTHESIYGISLDKNQSVIDIGQKKYHLQDALQTWDLQLEYM